MPFLKHILVYAEVPAVLRTQELILESLGFSVIAVKTVREVEYVASRSGFDLLILGRSLSDGHKIAAAKTFKGKLPNGLILEICDIAPCVDNPDYVLGTASPEALKEMVNSIFGIKRTTTVP